MFDFLETFLFKSDYPFNSEKLKIYYFPLGIIKYLISTVSVISILGLANYHVVRLKNKLNMNLKFTKNFIERPKMIKIINGMDELYVHYPSSQISGYNWIRSPSSLVRAIFTFYYHDRRKHDFQCKNFAAKTLRIAGFEYQLIRRFAR